MSTKVWCDDCERNEIVCECVVNDDRENGCYEFEQFQNCDHKEDSNPWAVMSQFAEVFEKEEAL